MEKYWQMFLDAWKLFKFCANAPSMDDETCTRAREVVQAKNETYQSPFFRALAIAVLDEAERMKK